SEAQRAPEDRRVNAPFVLAAAQRAGAVDDDLAVDRLDLPEVQQVRAGGPEPLEHRMVDGHRAEQLQRLDARRHQALERSRYLRLIGRLERGDAGRGLDRCIHGAPSARATEIEALR